MTIPVSITKAAKAAVFSTLQRSLTVVDDVHGLLVCYDDPGPELSDDIVSVGAVRRAIAAGGMVGSMGAGALQDTVSIDVTVSVFRTGDEAQVTFERGCDLVDAVLGAVRADPSLGGVVLVAMPSKVDYGPADWDDEHKGRVSESVVTITCTALI